MTLADRLAKVDAAEREVETRRAEAAAQARRTGVLWRQSWTPGRIMIVGLATGFLTGRAQPLKLAGSGGLLSLLRALDKLLETARSGAAAPSRPDAGAEPRPSEGDDRAVWPSAPRREQRPFVTTP